ncbi:MAG: hypothetical protein V4473_01660 [Patescibacteria group bacterium]
MSTQEYQATPAQKEFLVALKKSGIIERACKEAGISRTTFYRWDDREDDFSALVLEAMYEANPRYKGTARAILLYL